MPRDDVVAGDDPLVNGMNLSVRLRRDFTVTDAAGLLVTARRAYLELNPGASAEEASEMVVDAADALSVILERAGQLGDAVDSRLADCVADGIAVGGWRAQVVTNEPYPLSAGPAAIAYAATTSSGSRTASTTDEWS